MTDPITIDSDTVPSPRDLQAVVDIAVGSVAPQELTPGSIYSVAVPAGASVGVIDLDLDKYKASPDRKSGVFTVHDADSFVAYLAKHAVARTELWADVTTASLVAVINAHDESIPGDAEFGDAGWQDHRLRLALHNTTAWKTWVTHDGQILEQQAFAELVEGRIVDFVEPSGADMLELAQSFKASLSGKFESSRRLGSGESTLEFVEEHQATAGQRGQLVIPDTFSLALKPFEGSEAYKVTARFRYRINDGTLKLCYVLDRPEDILRDAFDDFVSFVSENQTQPIFRGITA